MAVTNRTLANVHMFPTLALYSSNSSSITNTDIAFVKASGATNSSGELVDYDLGNIIDQQLGDNGYIKYSCGIIIQWMHIGGSTSETDYKYFPIAFPNECFSIASSDCWKGRSIDNVKYSIQFCLIDKTKFLIKLQSAKANSGKAAYVNIGNNIGVIAIGH